MLIKNTFNPAAPGTLISKSSGDDQGHPIAKGISSVGDLTLLTLRGLSMVGVPGIAERLFRALAPRRVNVILISQASSEHTICFAVRRRRTPRRRSTAIAATSSGSSSSSSLTAARSTRPDQAILAVVGEGMKGRPGVAGKVFGALGPPQHQHQRDRPGRVRAQHLVRHRRGAAGARAQRHPPGVLRDAQAAGAGRSSASATSAARCCGSCTQQRAYLLRAGIRRHGRRPRQQQAVRR